MNTTHPNPLIAGFIAGLTKPITALEEITIHLEAALDCARDATRSEAERVKELKLRIQLMPPAD
jgi:hypothetical protein